MSLPDNIRSLFGAIPGAPRGSTIGAMAGPGFITGAEANQTHAQAGTRAGGWAEGIGSNATAVSSLAGIASALGMLAVPRLWLSHCIQNILSSCLPTYAAMNTTCRTDLPLAALLHQWHFTKALTSASHQEEFDTLVSQTKAHCRGNLCCSCTGALERQLLEVLQEPRAAAAVSAAAGAEAGQQAQGGEAAAAPVQPAGQDQAEPAERRYCPPDFCCQYLFGLILVVLAVS